MVRKRTTKLSCSTVKKNVLHVDAEKFAKSGLLRQLARAPGHFICARAVCLLGALHACVLRVGLSGRARRNEHARNLSPGPSQFGAFHFDDFRSLFVLAGLG